MDAPRIRNAVGGIFHTCSSHARAGDALIGAHDWLDLTPKGRDERSALDWVRLHDEYKAAPAPSPRHEAIEAAQ